ncbi:MAG: chalcone isomerase [Flavobacteriales bacterium]|nr:chalcone isomerase [Flavobacteriales bacterium]
MNRILMLVFTVVGLTAFSQTKTIAGVKFPTTTKVNGKTLEMNGGGLREKYWIDLYVAALYLENKTTDAGKIIYADDEQAIHIKIISGSVTRERFIESVKEGFSNANHGKATPEQIKKFMGFFNEEIKEGDRINLEYTPKEGLVVIKNGTEKGKIEGVEFKKALFSIWLGSTPADATLKKGMLGKN